MKNMKQWVCGVTTTIVMSDIIKLVYTVIPQCHPHSGCSVIKWFTHREKSGAKIVYQCSPAEFMACACANYRKRATLKL